MSHSKTKFNTTWLKKKDSNGHLLEWWCNSHETDKFKAVCKLCEKDIQVANNGCHALMQHATKKIHKQKAVLKYSFGEGVSTSKDATTSKSESDQMQLNATKPEDDKTKKQEGCEGSKQASIKHFFVNKAKDTGPIPSTSSNPETTSDTGEREETMSLSDQICKAEALWALKTAKDDFSFRASDGFPQLLQRMCPDSEIARKMTMSRTKVSYIVGHGIGPYFIQKTVDDILRTPGTYFTLHFDETTTSQIKKQLDILVRYYSERENEVRVRFLKAAVFGHAFADTVANELCNTLEKFSLPLKYLLSLSSDGPNVNKAIKTNINRQLMTNHQRELVDTGSCQLHVVHNSFRKGVEGYGEDIENMCIDIFYFFQLSPPRREDYADIQQKLNLDELVFLCHVQ